MNTLSKIVENHDTIFDTNKIHGQNKRKIIKNVHNETEV